MKNFRKYLAECLGTFFLTFVGTTVAVTFGGASGGIQSIVGIALAFGLTIVAVYYTLGRYSGGHVNPAVSVAMFFDGRLSLTDLIGYIVFQIIGGLLGSLTLFIILKCIPNAAISTYGLGANGYGSASAVNVTMTGAIFVEVLLTAIFVFVVLAVTKDHKYDRSGGFIIGAILTMVHLVGIPFTGTSVNPARSIGPAVVMAISTGKTTALSQLWVFILAPLVGALIATVIWKAFNLDQ